MRRAARIRAKKVMLPRYLRSWLSNILSPTSRRWTVIHEINTFDFWERLDCRLVELSQSAFRRPVKADTVDDPDLALSAWLRGYARRHDPLGISEGLF